MCPHFNKAVYNWTFVSYSTHGKLKNSIVWNKVLAIFKQKKIMNVLPIFSPKLKYLSLKCFQKLSSKIFMHFCQMKVCLHFQHSSQVRAFKKSVYISWIKHLAWTENTFYSLSHVMKICSPRSSGLTSMFSKLVIGQRFQLYKAWARLFKEAH